MKSNYAIFTASREGFNDSIRATVDDKGEPFVKYEQAYAYLFKLPDPTKLYIWKVKGGAWR